VVADPCPHCQAGEPSVWDDVLFHYAHPAGVKLKMCHSPWRERCRRCSGDVSARSSLETGPLLCTTCIRSLPIECDRLRGEVDRLSKALADAYTAVEALTADRDRLRVEIDAEADFEKGYNQAVDEIHDHFAKAGMTKVCTDISRIWRGTA